MSTKTDLNHQIIGGVALEAVRNVNSRNGKVYWTVKVVATGAVREAGVFKSESRPKMWESVRETARVCGPDRWTRENA